MSGINFLSDNLVDNATFNITTGSANAQFPISNISNDSTKSKFRSIGNTIIFEADLQTVRDINTVAIVGDATSGLEITAMSIRTSVTTDFSGSAVTPITLSAEYNIGYEFITPVTHRFVEITLTGNGSFAEISNIFIGERLNLPLNSFSIGSFTYTNNDLSKISSNKYGQKFIDLLNTTKTLSGTIEFCTQSEMDSLDTMYLSHGTHKPLWVILDSDSDAMFDGKFRLAQYGYLKQIPKWTASGGQLYNSSLELNQVV